MATCGSMHGTRMAPWAWVALQRVVTGMLCLASTQSLPSSRDCPYLCRSRIAALQLRGDQQACCGIRPHTPSLVHVLLNVQVHPWVMHGQVCPYRTGVKCAHACMLTMHDRRASVAVRAQVASLWPGCASPASLAEEVSVSAGCEACIHVLEAPVATHPVEEVLLERPETKALATAASQTCQQRHSHAWLHSRSVTCACVLA